MPDEDIRHGRRGQRAKRPVKLHPEAQAAVEKLLGDLDSDVKCARKE